MGIHVNEFRFQLISQYKIETDIFAALGFGLIFL